MVCSKCQSRLKTSLATPAVKRSSDLIRGSSAASAHAGATSAARKSAATSGGVGKSKLLGGGHFGGKNPYASSSAGCAKCKARVEEGRALCHSCAFKTNSCVMCGKGNAPDAKAKGKAGDAKKGVITGQKFSNK